jgi:hypothetical protein
VPPSQPLKFLAEHSQIVPSPQYRNSDNQTQTISDAGGHLLARAVIIAWAEIPAA